MAKKSKADRKGSGERDMPVTVVVYPPSPTAKFRVAVKEHDLEYLEPEEFLNDTIIDFYLQWFYREQVFKENWPKFHVFSSFFYTRLAKDKDCSKVVRWASDIFQKDYLFIPINLSLHWTLAVVCYANRVGKPEEDDEEEDKPQPCILYLDSLGGSGRGCAKHIYRYLNEMKSLALDPKDTDTAEFDGPKKSLPKNIKFDTKSMPTKNAKVPSQDNSYDCGLFVLTFAAKLLQGDIEKEANELIADGKPDWFDSDEPSGKREEIKNIIFKEGEKSKKYSGGK